MKKTIYCITILIFLLMETGCGGSKEASVPDSSRLRIIKFIPGEIPLNAALVVVLHGCNMTAESMRQSTGWDDLAAEYGFYVIYPGQVPGNNKTSCFNWQKRGDRQRGSGEALEIKLMIDMMKADYSISPDKIFITGLSAGGAMTNVMLAAYPDLFAAGAVIAGLAYKAEPGKPETFAGDPQVLGDKIRSASSHSEYPRVLLIHGKEDKKVPFICYTGQIQQWTNAHGTNDIISETNFNNNTTITRFIYKKDSKICIEGYVIEGLAHFLPIDPGERIGMGGYEDPDKPYFSKAVEGFHSTYWIAKFFNLL